VAWLPERPVTLFLVVPHSKKAKANSNPIQIVGDDSAVGGGVVPAKERVENTPATIQLGAATVDVPHSIADVIRAWSVASFSCISASELVELVGLKVSYGLGKETGTDEIEETSADDESSLQFCHITATVDEITDESASSEAGNDG